MVLNTRQAILVSQTLKRIPRGEMWLGHRLFQDLGWKDDLEARRHLCRELAMDIVFLPVGFYLPHNFLFDYRYFSLAEVSQLLAVNDSLLVSIVVDGPFQRLVGKMGLQALLCEWQTVGAGRVLQEESVQVGHVISDYVKCKPDVLVIADDIAYDRSTYVNPNDLEQSLFILYRDWVQQAHAHNILAFFHSDGNLSRAVPGLLACGFDGLAGCELECQDMLALKRQYGARLTFLTGVPTDLLEEELSSTRQEQFVQMLRALASGGRFVLCSSCGLSSAKHLSRLRMLYHWVDEAWNPSRAPQNLPYQTETEG